MIKRTLGRTGYEVSALGLGGFQFTSMFDVAPEEADAIIDYAIAHGVNLIDTAQCYGGGESEAIVGRALQRHPDDKPIICAKVGHLHEGILAGMKERAIEAFQDPKKIMATIKHSMWLMRVDHFDILLMHEVEREWKANFDTADCVIMEVLEQLKKEGLTQYIGGSSWDCSALAKMTRTGRFDVVMVAGGISLLNRWMFDELIPAAKEHDVGVLVGGCLGQNNPGLVNKDRAALEAFLQSEDEKVVSQARKLSKLYDLSDELGLNMVQLAVRYVLSFPEIHSHTLGARALAHIQDNIATVEMGPLASEYVTRINAIQDEGNTDMKLKEFTNVFKK
ncbi:aldo/keto reductase [Intestinibacillus sp. NTUH-41-i26]|uniref:aldo/keto reductase n=1 Tax=Butyricicoccaceae TaxID=3085642 RepID=UPI00131E54CB|nr:MULTISPECIES: aldo/keto reductase [Butyricicoccaceae]WOC76589.1 aldo/keto reductase [Intestinibacillus sp. NTUH-41-i26]